MRIVLEDGFAIQKGGGIGQLTNGIYSYLQSCPDVEHVWIIPKPLIGRFHSAIVQRILYVAWVNSWLHLHLRAKKIDIIHFTNYLIPLWKATNTQYVVSIHDLNPWRFPETIVPAYIPYIKAAITHAVQNADLVFTLSNTVKGEINELFGLDEHKIITGGCTTSQKVFDLPREKLNKKGIELKKKLRISGDFIIFVSTLEKRKNAITLVRAFEQVIKSYDIQLILVGRDEQGSTSIRNYISSRGLQSKVILTGYLTEDELICLYDNAKLFVWPSLYEGFGIPVLEAMIRGLPVVASDIPVTREIAGSAVVYYHDPLDYKALTEIILEVISNNKLKQELITRGLEQSKLFSWEKIGKRYLQAYSEICKK